MWARDKQKQSRARSAEVADVVISLSYTNFKTGLAWHVELLAHRRLLPFVAAFEFVFARAAHALHDFGGAGVESEGRRENNAHRFFGAVCQGDVVANALAVKVNVGLRGDGDVVEFFGGHG